jgi:purine nucleosidase
MQVLIDTDPGMGTVGVDPEDAFAITMALSSPGVTVEAIACVQGNVPIRHSLANATHLLELLGRRDVLVAAGLERPLLAARRRQQERWLTETDGRERLLPAAERPYPAARAVEVILRAARESDGLTIVAIGPLTNIAAALVADPELPSLLERIVVMGGAFEVCGNITPTAEFNFFMDPEAAQIVLDARLRPELIGLDVCHQTHLTHAQMAAVEFTTPLGRFVRRACAAWLPTQDGDAPHLYDSLAMAAALEPQLVTLEPARVEIETVSAALAGTSAAWLRGRFSEWSRPDGPDNALVATEVDVDGFAAFFAERVLARL